MGSILRRLGSWSLAVLILTGCENPFPPRTLVERLRVLAIQAEPPAVDLSMVVRLRALVAEAGPDAEFDWQVCLFDPGRVSSVACPGPDGFALPAEAGEGILEFPRLIASLPPGLLPEPGSNDSLDLESVEVPIGLTVRAGSAQVTALKRLKVQLNPDQTPNHNPNLTGLLVNSRQVDSEPVRLSPGQKVALTPMVAADSREWYTPDGESERKLEDHLFAWYSTGGEFSDRRTILDVDSQGNSLLENTFTAPGETGPVTLWVVLRDGRYGTDWLQFAFSVE